MSKGDKHDLQPAFRPVPISENIPLISSTRRQDGATAIFMDWSAIKSPVLLLGKAQYCQVGRMNQDNKYSKRTEVHLIDNSLLCKSLIYPSGHTFSVLSPFQCSECNIWPGPEKDLRVSRYMNALA